MSYPESPPQIPEPPASSNEMTPGRIAFGGCCFAWWFLLLFWPFLLGFVAVQVFARMVAYFGGGVVQIVDGIVRAGRGEK